MDPLTWSRWHTRVVLALGISWMLGGPQITLAGGVGKAIQDPSALGLGDAQSGSSATAYLAGAVPGALAIAIFYARGSIVGGFGPPALIGK